LGVLAAAVAHHTNLAAGFLVLGPRAHDERIVDRDADDVVDALCLERIVIRDIARHMLRRARRGERPWKAEDDNLLAFGEIFHLKLIRADGAAGRFDIDIFAERAGREPVADFYGHGISLYCGRQRTLDRRAA